ncbi:MAG: hypothetical protein SGPRY_011264 [Prymnesium sp.]
MQDSSPTTPSPAPDSPHAADPEEMSSLCAPSLHAECSASPSELDPYAAPSAEMRMEQALEACEEHRAAVEEGQSKLLEMAEQEPELQGEAGEPECAGVEMRLKEDIGLQMDKLESQLSEMLKPFPRSASGESAYRGAEQQEEAEGTERVRKPGTWRNTTHSPIPSPRPPSSASERSQELSQKQGFCCDSSGLKEMPRTRMPRGRHSCTVHKSSKSGGASGLSGSSPTSEPVMVMDGLTPGQRALGAAGRDRCARARIAREASVLVALPVLPAPGPPRTLSCAGLTATSAPRQAFRDPAPNETVRLMFEVRI